MTEATKRKYVTNEVLNDFILPGDKQTIVKIVATKGNNLHMVTSSTGDMFLASMPPKFRKNIWIKRGDYVVVESIAEGDRVKGEIVAILYKDQIKHIKSQDLWPFKDETSSEHKGDNPIPDDMLPPSDSDSDPDNNTLIVNPNRPNVVLYQSDSESDSETENNANDPTVHTVNR